MLSPCALHVQRHDPDRFVTALFAPADKRETLFTLYAFNHEIARAREVASQPTLALIRLHWWREVVQGADKSHEVATPLRAAVAAGRLDAGALAAMIAARELEAEAELDEADWLAYLAGAGGQMMLAAGLALGAAEAGPALMEAGAACAAVGLLRNQAAHRAQGRWSFPRGQDAGWAAEWAGAALAPYRYWPAAAIPASLPIVLARRHLRRLRGGRMGPDGLARLAAWAAARRGWY